MFKSRWESHTFLCTAFIPQGCVHKAWRALARRVHVHIVTAVPWRVKSTFICRGESRIPSNNRLNILLYWRISWSWIRDVWNITWPFNIKTKYQVALANISNSDLPTAKPSAFPLFLEQVQTFHAQIQNYLGVRSHRISKDLNAFGRIAKDTQCFVICTLLSLFFREIRIHAFLPVLESGIFCV